MERQLIKVAKELNVGMATIVEYLNEKGFDVDNKPIAKISDGMYDVLAKKFSDSRAEKQKTDQIIIGTRPIEKRIVPPPIVELIDGKKVFRLWKFIAFDEKWENTNTSIVDDIAPSWLSKRDTIKEDSREYTDFLEKLKREHAIETGVVERLYDIDRGITHTLIEKGFKDTYLSHGDTNVPVNILMNHLKDHLHAIDFVFDIIKENRPLSTSFIKELHQLVTKHQSLAEGRDQFGHKTKIELLKGTYKIRENNPTRDETLVLYCPPDHVAAEMDNLVAIYDDLENKKIHPIIIATWFHHAFTTIHPFQDGNGRLVRLLASLILIKHNFFPFTVLRDTKSEYIDALEAADLDNLQKLIDYFCDSQRRSIEKALNVKEVSGTSLLEVAKVFSQKLETWQNRHLQDLSGNRDLIYNYSFEKLGDFKTLLKQQFNGNVNLTIKSAHFNDLKKNFFYDRQVIEYAKKHNYFFQRDSPKAWMLLQVEINKTKTYQIGFSIHHFGYDDSTISISAFLLKKGASNIEDTSISLEIKPYVVSINLKLEDKTLNNISAFIEDILTISLVQVANELT